MHRCSCVGRYLAHVRPVLVSAAAPSRGDRPSWQSYMYIYNIIADTDLRGETKNSAPRTGRGGERCQDRERRKAARRRGSRFSFCGLASPRARRCFPGAAPTRTPRFCQPLAGLGAKRLLPAANSFPKRALTSDLSGADALITRGELPRRVNAC